MFKYKGVHCPHCGKEFKETDQILICPDCGAPYHKACIQELGQCQFQELHAKGESWQPPKTAAEEAEERCDGMASRRCSRCGTLNSPDKLFCEVCGTPLNREDKEENPDQPGGFQQFGNGSQQAGPGFYQMPYNPYTTPFGGLGADEEIEEIPVKDLALYVKENTHYFLPKFKEMSTRKKSASWNWAAFFLDGIYLLYRKVWSGGILVLVATLILSLPSLAISYSSLYYNLNGSLPFARETILQLDNLGNVCYILSLALKLAVALFSNRLYKDKVFKDVRKIRENGGDSSALSAKGGVSKAAVIVCVVVILVVSMGLSFSMVSAIAKL